MGKTVLRIPQDIHRAILDHVLHQGVAQERAAFVFAGRPPDDSEGVFGFRDWYAVPPDGYLVQSAYHFELTDEVRAGIIKRAHDLGASIVEFHSHPGPWPARFSPSDMEGLHDFVPHAWWRLGNRPYIAVVLTPRDFDALIWLKGPEHPEALGAIEVDGVELRPTGLSSRTL